MSQLTPSANIVALYEAINGQAPGNTIYNHDLPFYTSGTAQADTYLSQVGLTDAGKTFTQIFGNLGLATTSTSTSSAAVTAQAGLYAALVSIVNTPSNKISLAYGVNWLVNALATIPSTDPNYTNYSAASTTLNANIANGVSYSGTTTNGAPESVSLLTGQTFTLGTYPDTVTGGSYVVVNGIDAPAGTTTWTPLDTITLTGTNNVFNLATTAAIQNPVGATVSGVQTMNVTEAGATSAITLNTTAFTGLTQLTATTAQATGAITTLTAAATTNVSLTGTTADATAGALTVLGGNNVTVVGKGSAIVVGGSTATDPTGTVTVTDTTQAAANVAVDGGVGVTVTTTGQTTGTVIVGATVPAAGAVSVTVGGLTTAARTGVVTVTGGSTITISDVVANTTTTGTALTGNVTATGGATTTAITVTQAATVAVAAASTDGANASSAGFAAVGGVTAGGVTIADKNAGSTTVANTIAAVTLNNWDDLQAATTSTISSTALNTLTLSGTGGRLQITEGGSTAQIAANTTLTLNLNGGSQGVLTDASNQFKTVNAVLTANDTVAGITDTALRTLAVSGTGVLTLSATNAALTSVTLAGAAGFNGTLVGTGVTALTAANTTGAVTATLNAATQTFTGGTGRDIITIAADATKVITGGSGTTDRLILSNTAATYTLANTNTKVTGFEQLITTNVGGGTYNMASFTGFNVVGVNVAASTNTFTNVAAGTSLNLESDTVAVVYQAALGTTSVAVNLVGTAVTAANGGGTAGFATTALTLSDINSVGLATVTINSDASVFQGLHTIATLTDTTLSNLAITGTGSLGIGLASTNATTLTISDNGTGASATADGFTTSLTSSGNGLGAINYSGTHAFTTVLLVDNVANLAITNANTGTSGVFTVSGHTNTNAAAASLTLTGAVAYTGNYDAATGAMTVSGATDNSAVSLSMNNATGIKTITLGNGANIVVTGGAADVITVGTGANSITGGAGADRIVLGAHTGIDRIIYTAADQGGATASATGVAALAAGDTIGATGTAFTVATDLINVLAATSGTGVTHTAGTGLINTWSLLTNSIYVETGTYVAAGATSAAVSAAIGTVTFTNATVASGMVAIQTAAASNVWNLYQVDLAVGSTHAGNTALAAADTISLVGTFTTSGALTVANFVA